MEIENLNNQLFGDICKLIEEAKSIVANTANRTITLLYWKIGERINNDLLKGKRAGYGDQIVSQLATQLQQIYGKKGFETRNIRRMMQFATLFADFQIVSQAATLTEMPDKQLLKQQLHKALIENKKRWEENHE